LVVVTHGATPGGERRKAEPPVAVLPFCDRGLADGAARVINEESDFLVATVFDAEKLSGACVTSVQHVRPGWFKLTEKSGSSFELGDL
jgi:hypothetical protein